MRGLRIKVPGQPVGKGRPRFSTRGGHARAFTPEKTVNFENWIALNAMGHMEGLPLIEGPIYITITALFAIPSSWSKKKQATARSGLLWHTGKPDADNIAKAVGDSLNGVVWKDDSQVAFLKVIKQYADEPCLDLLIEEIAA